MRLGLRVAILALACAGLVYGLTFESRTVWPVAFDRGSDAGKTIDGLSFVEGATQDAYILRDGLLCDAYSLVPEFAQVKDCKT